VGGGGGGDDRKVTRGFSLLDHRHEGLDNFVTITGGKLTTYRLMAEKTADLVCEHLGVSQPCRTRFEPLPDVPETRWTRPGLAPRRWLQNKNREDFLLCECEMVSKSVVDSIVGAFQGGDSGFPVLESLGLRSRVGKGPCQGTFCSQRVVAHLFDRGKFHGRQGVKELQSFVRERWRGQHPLLWDAPLMHAELKEALHCGFFGLELEREDRAQSD
jgi:glycerol-3-phosphate dehydrogenase